MAKRFRFNLEAVLRYRQIMEDQKRRDFADANRKLEEERLRREELLRERNLLQDEIVQSFEGRAPFQSIVASYHTVNQLDLAARESLGRQNVLEQEKEKRREIFVHARQDTKVMETLKERRREEYIKEMDRVEQGILDELSQQAQTRRMREARREAGLAE